MGVDHQLWQDHLSYVKVCHETLDQLADPQLLLASCGYRYMSLCYMYKIYYTLSKFF